MDIVECRLGADCKIRFIANKREIADHIRLVMDGFFEQCDEPSILAEFEGVDTLPILPEDQLFFVDRRERPHQSRAILSAYKGKNPNHIWLLIDNLALAEIDISERPFKVHVWILYRQLDSTIFEDVIFASLAFPLRRLGYYLLHAFCAMMPDLDQSILLVAPSNGGKTTTGLKLLFDGWKLIANDIVILHRVDAGIMAYPTPNICTIRPQTFSLLPKLRQLLPANAEPSGSVFLSSHQLIGGRWGEPSLVSGVFFPSIKKLDQTTVEPMPISMGTSLLLEESLDMWDSEAVLDNMNLIGDLSKQSQSFALNLGTNIKHVSYLLNAQFVE